MLTLDPASACEVCAETFGPGHVPAVIPCGHVFCAQCLSTIVDKTSPRLTPACPLCRGTFSDKTWRLIRVDLGGSGTGSGWSGSSSDNPPIEASGRVRADARRLEEKVAEAAVKKCSFEEVQALHKEVSDWLSHDNHTSKSDPQHSGLRLSADLLRAILLNCISYSESTKLAKSREQNLQAEVDTLRQELRRQRDLVHCRTQEIERLRDELNRLRPNNATKHTTRPGLTTATPPRPGTSLGFSSTASARSMTSSVPSVSVSTTPTRPGSVAPRVNSNHPSPGSSASSVSSTSPPRPPSPQSPAILPPAPLPGYMSLAPSPTGSATPLASSTPVPPEVPSRTASFASRGIPVASQTSRSQTPGPMLHRRTSSSHSSVPVRPSTAMGARTQHERWIPTQAPTPSGIPPPLARSSRFAMSSRGFQVVEEAD